MPKNSGLKENLEPVIEAARRIAGGNAEELFFRGEDIPAMAEEFNTKEIPAMGLTGNDLFQEYLYGNDSTLGVLEKIEWKGQGFIFGKPNLCLIGKEELQKGKIARIAVNRKYSRLSMNFLEKLSRNGIKFRVMKMSGSTELAVAQGIADYCVEIVCTGKTVEELGLKVMDRYLESDWVLIGRKTSASTVDALYSKARERISSESKESYTAGIVKEGKVLKKLSEECFELIEATLEGKREKIVWETADLVYFLTVLLAQKGIRLQEVRNELERRELERAQKGLITRKSQNKEGE